MIICRKGDRRQQNRKMCYYTQKTNRQPSGRAIRLTCVTTQFSKLLMWKHEETKHQKKCVGHKTDRQIFRHVWRDMMHMSVTDTKLNLQTDLQTQMKFRRMDS